MAGAMRVFSSVGSEERVRAGCHVRLQSLASGKYMWDVVVSEGCEGSHCILEQPRARDVPGVKLAGTRLVPTVDPSGGQAIPATG